MCYICYITLSGTSLIDAPNMYLAIFPSLTMYVKFTTAGRCFNFGCIALMVIARRFKLSSRYATCFWRFHFLDGR
ncbi:hypothetical protein C1646_687790 [Rhizophagus diaphanus]|nr:hypothetical protein C1646_687790 [Rhizophagus diaphanus] [Rhizophagus sp. MUCL 43196]